MNIAIIGAGAAGLFSAINLKKLSPDVNVSIFESSLNVLSKVGVSGGGRCNLTNSFEDVKAISTAYPRGDKLIKRLFKIFDYKDSYQWFEDNGVHLVTQDDRCVFPYSQDSQEIIDTFLSLARRLDIKINISYKVTSIEKIDGKFELSFARQPERVYDAVIVTTGGSPMRENLSFINNLPVDIVEPVPSLFTFNIPNNQITQLMGTVVENTVVGLKGTKFKASGALLITHWGVSGPAILKLSSYGARYLSESDYNASVLINWINQTNEENIYKEINRISTENPHKLVTSIRPFNVPSRLWLHIMKRAEISDQRRWVELGRKGIIRIINSLTNDEYPINGKSRFREEFVTCGGVALDSVSQSTLECKQCENLYFAGEVLDIDAITGGFNLQAAWTTGYVVAKSISEKL